MRLADRNLQTVYGNRILCTDIDITLMRTDCVSHDGHTFKDCMRIAFQNGTVHKCARVAFVSVADDILLITRLILFKLPFDTCRETCAAASAESAGLHLIDDFLRCHGGQSLRKSLITINRNIFCDIFRTDSSAVAQCNTLLLLIELDLFNIMNALLCLRIFVIQLHVFNDTSVNDMFLNNALGIFRFYMAVINVVREDCHDRTLLAETETACLNKVNFSLNTALYQFCLQIFDDLVRIGSVTSGTAAGKHIKTDLVIRRLFHAFTQRNFTSGLLTQLI